MRICVDVQAAVTQRAGVGRYTRQLVEHLVPLLQGDELRLVYFDFMRRGTPPDTAQAVRRAIRWCPGRLAEAAWRTAGWPPYNWLAGAADVYHFPNFFLPPLTRGRSVVTIHDLSFLRFPEFAEERNRKHMQATIRRTVDRADAILTESRFVAGEIAALLGADAARVFSTYAGISGHFRPPDAGLAAAARKDLGLERPYLLTVGTLEPRKNVPFLVEVFERLPSFDGQLVIAGMPGWNYGPILDRIRTSRRAKDIRYLRYVPEDRLPALYAGASVFLFASFYEGFGFPPLEAMACGAPVVSSTGGSLREVLEPAALLLDRFDAELWADRVEEILRGGDLRRRLISEGRRQAARYTWTEAAARTCDVYRQVARW
jgi:glycosyltransferase involved in cell wall biosynthesis